MKQWPAASPFFAAGRCVSARRVRTIRFSAAALVILTAVLLLREGQDPQATPVQEKGREVRHAALGSLGLLGRAGEPYGSVILAPVLLLGASCPIR